MLRERDEVLLKAQRDAELVIEEARARVAQMVQKTEVARAAESKARQVVENAEAQARRRRHEVDDYCDQRLAQFDAALERIHQTVNAAREKLQPTPLTSDEPEAAPVNDEHGAAGAAFFDQDQA